MKRNWGMDEVRESEFQTRYSCFPIYLVTQTQIHGMWIALLSLPRSNDLGPLPRLLVFQLVLPGKTWVHGWELLAGRRIFTFSVLIVYHPMTILYTVLVFMGPYAHMVLQKAIQGIGCTEVVSLKVWNWVHWHSPVILSHSRGWDRSTASLRSASST